MCRPTSLRVTGGRPWCSRAWERDRVIGSVESTSVPSRSKKKTVTCGTVRRAAESVSAVRSVAAGDPDGDMAEQVIIVGGGRAGGALAIAAHRAGHAVSLIPGPSGRIPAGFDGPVLDRPGPLPAADLIVLAVRDDAIAGVADDLSARLTGRPIVVHLSGLTGLDVLASCAAVGCPVGSFHPLMTLPDPIRGSQALAGATATITSDTMAFGRLAQFATTLGMKPRLLAEDRKALYHAAAAAASNFVTAILGIAGDLADAAGVAAEDLRPLTRAAVEAAFDAGADVTLTGPVARGDWSTVSAQLSAIDADLPELSSAYRALVALTAERVGRGDEARVVVGTVT